MKKPDIPQSGRERTEWIRNTVQARLDGKEIHYQVRRKDALMLVVLPGDNEPYWDWHNIDYWPAPEPMVMWMNINENGGRCVYHSQQEADEHAMPSRVRCVKLVEDTSQEA